MTRLDTSNTPIFVFTGAQFTTLPPTSLLHIYSEVPGKSLSLDLLTSLGACLNGTHLPNFTCTLSSTLSSTPSITPTTVGALYEAWHAPPSASQSIVVSQGGTPLSVEDVLRSGYPAGSPPNLTLSDIFDKYPGAAAQSDAFFYQEHPSLGYYCIYRKRPSEPTGLIPDCLNIPATITQHSKWLTDASVDFITVDGTNLCTPSTQEELIQQRPMEVVFEEFHALRSQGIPTPRIAAWQRIVSGCITYPAVLALYNNETYKAADLFLKAADGRRVFFVPASPDPALVQAVESNGGRNDIVTQVMWALFDQKEYRAEGEWGFMSPCTVAEGSRGGKVGSYTTSVMGLGRGALGCGQNLTVNSTLGSAMAVSPSYQLSYGSVPFSAAGKFEGLTLQRQFGSLFDNAGKAFAGAGAGSAVSPLPDFIYLSSWNEWTSQPQTNPFKSNFSFSMGLQGDKDGGNLYVDSYGTALSRDLEPSARPGGDALYNLLASCLRVVRLMQGMHAFHSGREGDGSGVRGLAAYFGKEGVSSHNPPSSSPPLVSCAVQGEQCCMYNETLQGYALSTSLTRVDATDALVSSDQLEIQTLLAGGAWVEVCNGYGGGTDFCVDGGVLKSQRLAGQGPFLLHSGGCGEGVVTGSGAQAGVVIEGRVLVQRCVIDGGGSGGGGVVHFMSNFANCSGVGKPETVVGCADVGRSSNMPRALYACSGKGSPPRYHSLDMGCLRGDEQILLGYAH